MKDRQKDLQKDHMMTRSKLHREAGREDGAAAVEFALIVGLLVMLVFGMMEYGLAFWQVQNLRAATREGARVAAVGGDTAQVTDAVVGASAGALPAGFGGISVSGGGCPEPSAGNPVDQSVTVSIDNGSLPASVQESFAINIPLLPPISLDPTIEGTFRCEPV
jgi:Flp pilus assembly protein TadG